MLGAWLALAGGALTDTASSSGSGGTTAVSAKRAQIVELQRALGVPADGIYGRRTRRAVRAFQRAHGLVVDGIAGPRTRRALGLTGTGARTGSLLQRIGACESGGDPRAVSADGRYRGKYQFTRATWRSLGGTGDPAKAAEATQDRIALLLYRQRGASPWPVCGAR
jgi:peptidoglycan hydrolase-like protein with peptidoglycan-binding domain